MKKAKESSYVAEWSSMALVINFFSNRIWSFGIMTLATLPEICVDVLGGFVEHLIYISFFNRKRRRRRYVWTEDLSEIN